ncbi:hypothetical protein ACRTEV_13110 [Rossellomorea arthrocnemi]
MKKRLLMIATASFVLLGGFGAIKASTDLAADPLPPVYSGSSVELAADPLPPVYSSSSVKAHKDPLPPVY